MGNLVQAKNGIGYTGTAKALHWLMVALLIVQFVLAWTMPDIRRHKARHFDQPASFVRGIDPRDCSGASGVAAKAQRAAARRRRTAVASAIGPRRTLAALSAAVRSTFSWLDECLVSRLSGHTLRPCRIAEVDGNAITGLCLDRRRARAASDLRAVATSRATCCGGTLPLAGAPRRRAAADAARQRPDSKRSSSVKALSALSALSARSAE